MGSGEKKTAICPGIRVNEVKEQIEPGSEEKKTAICPGKSGYVVNRKI